MIFPSCMPLLGTTCLLIFKIFSYLHKYLGQKYKKNISIPDWTWIFQGDSIQTKSIQQIVQEKKGLYSKKDKNSMKIRISFLHALDTFLPTCLFGTTCLLVFAKFSLLHVYLALHIYLEHKSTTHTKVFLTMLITDNSCLNSFNNCAIPGRFKF